MNTSKDTTDTNTSKDTSDTDNTSNESTHTNTSNDSTDANVSKDTPNESTDTSKDTLKDLIVNASKKPDMPLIIPDVLLETHSTPPIKSEICEIDVPDGKIVAATPNEQIDDERQAMDSESQKIDETNLRTQSSSLEVVNIDHPVKSKNLFFFLTFIKNIKYFIAATKKP